MAHRYAVLNASIAEDGDARTETSG